MFAKDPLAQEVVPRLVDHILDKLITPVRRDEILQQVRYAPKMFVCGAVSDMTTAFLDKNLAAVKVDLVSMITDALVARSKRKETTS